jgi:hypothetical protein
VLPEVPAEWFPRHVLDDLSERGEAVVAVAEPCSWLGYQGQATVVVLGKRWQGCPQLHALTEVPPERAADGHDLRDPGRVCEQMPQRRGPPTRIDGLEVVGAQVLARGSVEIDQTPLPELQHGDRRECLGDRGDPEDRVLGDRRARRDVGDAVRGE